MTAFFSSAWAQNDDLLSRILEVNMPPVMEASWHRVRHLPMLQDDLVSDGKIYLQQPDKIRWETLSPVQNVTVLSGQGQQGRFRLPQKKDFIAQVLEDRDYTVLLTPLRRDLKQIFDLLTLTVDRESLQIKQVLLRGAEGEWTLIEFSDIRHEALPASIFEK